MKEYDKEKLLKIATEAEEHYEKYRRLNYEAMKLLGVNEQSSREDLNDALFATQHVGLTLLRSALAKWHIAKQDYSKRGRRA